jgi:hypothetical protein
MGLTQHGPNARIELILIRAGVVESGAAELLKTLSPSRRRTNFSMADITGQKAASGICSALEVGRDRDFPQLFASSEQAYAPEKLLKTLIGAISVKNRVDGEVSHPDGVIVIGSLQPLECVLFLV